MKRPFRFGVQFHSLDPGRWKEQARRLEALGYSTAFWPDHFSDQWDPTVAMTAMAAATERLNVGSLVYDVDYRHPVVFAKAAATLQLVSGGRHEFGIGAGWMETDYTAAGIPYDRPGIRIERLEEAVRIIRSMWTGAGTTFEGRHYQVKDIAAAAPPADIPSPRILIGGGGPRLFGVAGRHADIVGINPTIRSGRVDGSLVRELTPESVREKAAGVREAAAAAGRPDDAIEFTGLIFAVAIADDVSAMRKGLGANAGLSPTEVADCALFLTGSASEIRDTLERRREDNGTSYIVIQAHSPKLVEDFAEQIVTPLAGALLSWKDGWRVPKVRMKPCD